MLVQYGRQARVPELMIHPDTIRAKKTTGMEVGPHPGTSARWCLRPTGMWVKADDLNLVRADVSLALVRIDLVGDFLARVA